MEKKKSSNKTKKTTAKKVAKKVTTKKVAPRNSKKKKKGFTLIELLAVIIILGILMIIAIPSVTKYISDARKSAYVDTAKEIIAGARNLVNEGKLEMFDTDTTYYIDQECIQTENASKSPYGDFTKAYVVVTYNGTGYDYYWTSVDDAGQGISKITKIDKLDVDKIESDLTENDIPDSLGIDGRNKYVIIDKEQTNCGAGIATNVTGKIKGTTGEELQIICKRATVLHTENCVKTDSSGCRLNNLYSEGATITYGNTSTTAGVLNSGDAFDCDVNADGIFNSNNERFYYVSPYYDSSIAGNDSDRFDNTKAVLSYYSIVSGGVSSIHYTYPYATQSEATNNGYTCGGVWGCNNYGPLVAYKQMPSKDQWNNSNIILPGTRKIPTDEGLFSTASGEIQDFEYVNKAARLLTAQELKKACGITKVGNGTTGELNNCLFLLETSNFSGAGGPYILWLESPVENISSWGWYINANKNCVNVTNVSTYGGLRPVITIDVDNIEY